MVTHSDGETAVVTAQRASSCDSCAGKSTCSTLGSWKKRSMELRVINRMGAVAGDEVVVEVPDHFILSSAIHLYGLPMLLFFAAGVAAYLVSPVLGLADRDLWAALAGITAIVLYYVVMGRRERSGHGREQEQMNARIVRIQTRRESPLVFHHP
ncbi:MAG: SoxR reducing system RseC family protein [Mariprofundaceae bacterium]|nr:SoxR reducing system RseC family protein [Mariprofundaceae bacterium]